MKLLKNFKDIAKKDVQIAGGKGASLGEMFSSNIPVPDGFVILSDAFQEFVSKTGLISEIEGELNKVNIESVETIDNASENICSMILLKEFPEEFKERIYSEFDLLNSKFVAVRSSATSEDSADAAWAGQLDTFLNTTRNNLIENIKKCWASLFTPRAIFYRFEKGLDKTDVSVAVVVQKMIQSEISGIAFSVHPVTEDRSHILIEAGYGLGEAVVSGSITPDGYVLDKKDLEIKSKNINEQKKALYKAKDGGVEWKNIEDKKANKQKLSDELIKDLSKLIINIENHYGFPCDIEWAYEKGKLYITQSRPITTLSQINKSDDLEIISKLQKHSFEKYESFSKIPVISWEYAVYGNMDNPYYKKFGITQTPNMVVLQDKNFEVWQELKTKIKLSNKKFIKEIIKDSHLIIKKYEKDIKSKLNVNLQELDNQKCADWLKWINDLFIKLYHNYSFYTEEYFDTNDEKLLKELPEVRMALSNFVDMLWQSCEKILDFIKKEYKISRKISDSLISSEILNILENKTDITKIKKDGESPVAFILLKNKMTTLQRKDVEKIRTFLEEQDPIKEAINVGKEEEKIKGNTAYKGNVKGKVIKINIKDYGKYKEIFKGQKDFILVAPMTRPEIVPFLKKALAIITDEGGITCHAAIVSRELKKPCIIGTKIATEILKNGDFVEVDADNGIVRILDRQEGENKQHGFELEFTREGPIELFYIWLEGYLESCKILKMNLKLPKRSFAIYEKGIIKGYTQKNNINLQKDAINKLDNKKLEKIIKDYLDNYNEFKKNPLKIKDNEFLSKLMSGFIITFILGDMIKNKLQKKALDARIKTEDFFSIILANLNLYSNEKYNNKENLVKQEGEEGNLIEKFKNYYKNKEITKHEGSFSPIVWGTAASSLESPLYRKYYPTQEFGPVAFLVKENQSIGFFSFDSYLGCAEDGLKRYLDGTFEEFKDMEKFRETLNKLYKKYPPKEIQKLKEDKFYELFKEIFSITQDLQIVTLFCEALYEDIVEKYFNKLKENENLSIEEFFNTASLVFFDSFFNQLEDTLINLDEKNLYDSQWAFSDYMGTAKLEEILEKANLLIREKGGITKIKKEKEELKEEILKNKKIIPKFKKKLNPNLLKLFEFTQETIKLRDLRKKDLFNCITLLSNFGRELIKRKKIPENLMPYIISQDLDSGIHHEENYKGILKIRKKGNLFYYNEGYFKEKNINYEEVKKDMFEFMDRNRGGEIKGNSAQRGFVKGVAKIILNQSQFKDFKQGEILVTSMTRPEFAPLMKKASAIVTDEGGLTCHAAIVSRELGIPCVIGTQNASRLIKDNDLIEVDADNGVVRILDETKTKTLKFVADRDQIPLYPWFLADECLTKSIKDIIGENIEKNILEFKKGHVYYYIDVNKFDEVGKRLLNKIIEDHKFYSLVEKNVLKTGKILMEFCDDIRKLNLSNLSNVKLNDLYFNYTKKLKTMRDWGWVPPLLDGFKPFLSDYLKEKFKIFLKKINKEKELENYYAILSSSERKSEVQTEEIERLRLISKINKNSYKIFENENIASIINELKENNPAISKLIIDHAEKFNWLTYGYNGPLMNESDVIKLIKMSLKDQLTIHKQLEKIKSHYKVLKSEKKKITKDLYLPKDLIYLFEVSSFFMHLKDLRKGIYQKSYVLMDPVIDEIAKRMKLSKKEIRYFNRHEIKEGLLNNQNFKKIAQERTKYCVALIKDGETQVYQNKEAKTIIEKNTYVEKIDKEIMELKGIVAYPGKIQGIAKVIEIVKDMVKIKKNEIMISPTTNPDLIMAMKKAAAFVTDMGGITSHAAIVAREMKKPCVTGTKIATKIIKDGDLVEVDANKGIVKILKKG